MTSVADDFFCLALDEHSGRPRTSPRVAAVGLAGGLLAELVMSGHCVVTPEGDIRALDVEPPVDEVGREVHDLLLHRPHHTDPGIWISYLARDSLARVGGRLAAEHVVVPVRKRGLTGVRTLYLPVSLSAVAWPGIRIAQQLGGSSEITLSDLTCAGLAVATDLIDRVLWDPDLHRQARATLPTVLGLLPPPLTTLLTRTTTAVADAVLTHRT